MALPVLTLNPGREKSVRNRHPWIFSGGVAKAPDCEDGSLVEVRSADGEVLGSGYYNSKSSIVARLLAFGRADPLKALQESLTLALEARSRSVPPNTNAFRLVNGEGDFIPGLIVDRYADVLVIQCGTLGIERLKTEIVGLLRKQLAPRAIYEKSALPSRREEGLEPAEGPLSGDLSGVVEILEHGRKFSVDIVGGQKTGFFLDQREMRALVGSLAQGKKVMNCFCYTGGFSVYAAAAGATLVESVDVSGPAVTRARENFELNGFPSAKHRFVEADVFEHLRSERDPFEIVILDPPAFAKKRQHINQACKGYSEINREGLRRVAPGGILITSSCSHFIDEKLFQQVIFQASRDSGRMVQVVGHHRHGFDHPVSIFHPEGAYLKSLVLQVR